MFKFNLKNRIIVEEVLLYFYLYQYFFFCDEFICLEFLFIEDEVGDFEEDVLKDWLFEECVLLDDLVDFGIQEYVFEEEFVELFDSCSEVLLLKDLMVDCVDFIIVDDIEVYFLNGECYKENLVNDVIEWLGLDNRKEGFDILVIVFKI